MWRSDPRRDTEPFSFTVQEKDRGREQFAFSENRGGNVKEEGCDFDSFWVGSEGDPEGEESAFSLGKERGRSHKDLPRRDLEGLSQ